MAITRLNIEEFIDFAASHPVVDVRSPGEYDHAHIPGALSLCIFNNEERKIIGTAYKQESREKAIKIGLEFFGKQMVKIVEAAEKIVADRRSATKEIGVHCWRGGMRSGAVAWLLDLYGFKVHLLNGGYKAYRRWVLQQFEKQYKLQILGGYTGSDKTGVLHELRKNSEVVIDLEQLAGHQGSAFGNLDLVPQPSQEQFENLLALELRISDLQLPIWVEAESQRIGSVNIPPDFFECMRTSPLYFLNVPFEQRLTHILNGYGRFPKERLINAIVRIKKRLGGLETKNAVNALLEDDVRACFAILLKYYDKVYLKSTYDRDNIESLISYVDSDTLNRSENTRKILEHVRSKR